MTTDPYRVVEPAPAPVAPSPEERLGGVRSVHATGALWQALAPAITGAGMIVVLGLSLAFTGKALLICVPFAAMVFALVGWSPFRARGTLVRLHANGIAVVRRGAVDSMLFDDVDELWYELDVTSVHVARLARIHAFRLIDHDGRELRVPLTVTAPVPLLTWATRHCSEPLLSKARREMRAGRSLTFGRVSIDQDSVTVGGTTLPWTALRLVRLQSGRIAFFRRQTLVPWKTVSLDRVPHPSVFAKLVEETAKKVDRDFPFQAG